MRGFECRCFLLLVMASPATPGDTPGLGFRVEG
jgi:hypothetical protein